MHASLSFLAIVVPLEDLGAPELEQVSELADLLSGPSWAARELSLEDLAIFGQHTLP